MSQQLLGVIVGALIGFVGTALMTLFQWCMERAKRREERLWHYRQEHIQRLRPQWDRLSGSLYEMLDMAEDVLNWLDTAGAVQEIEQLEELKREFDRRAPAIAEQRDRLAAQLSEIPSQVRTVLTIHDPQLGPSIISRTDEVLRSVGSLVEAVKSLEHKLLPEVGLRPDEITELKNQLSECRQALIRNIRQVETAIERYVTRL